MIDFVARNPQALVHFAQLVTNGLEFWEARRGGHTLRQVHLATRFLHFCLDVLQD
jgi:hypothetical protein